MRILYPCNPLDPKEPDQPFTDEFVAVQQLGIPVSLFAYDELSFGDFTPGSRIEASETVLYRECWPKLASPLEAFFSTRMTCLLALP